uniref:Retrotransposon gag domain-containing protein n=1 Tax=Glossina palpalis gambiensis TaxID=67801 RepID=A0A1B0BW55_9MUSC
MKSNRGGGETQPQLHTHAVLSYSTGVEILGYRLREVCSEIFGFTCCTRAVGLKNVAIRRGLTWYEPSFNSAHASQTGDESLATRLDPVFQRFKLGGSYTTAEYPADRSAAPLFESLSRKLTHLFKMSDDETPNIAHNASGNIADNGCSGHRQPGPAGETASPDLELASMLKEQHEMLLICVQEIGNLKQEKSAATQRTQLRDSEGTRNFLMAASTSIPQQRMPSQTVAHLSGSHQHDQQAGQQRTSDENARRRDIDLNRWHVKFDGSGKGLTVESFVFRVERLRQQQQISYEELFAEFHCLVTGQASKWYWQLLEDREGDVTFDYFALKAELLNQFKTADSDYELIREIMEAKAAARREFRGLLRGNTRSNIPLTQKNP